MAKESTKADLRETIAEMQSRIGELMEQVTVQAERNGLLKEQKTALEAERLLTRYAEGARDELRLTMENLLDRGIRR